jgi:hypothetical protein
MPAATLVDLALATSGLRRAIGRCLLWFINGAHPPLNYTAVEPRLRAMIEEAEERFKRLSPPL